MDLGLTMVSHRNYVELAVRMGLSPLGNRLVCMDRIIGWRTNRNAYVHPHVFKAALGRYPPGYFPSGVKAQYVCRAPFQDGSAYVKA